jgi:hypothetical protein
LGRADDRDETVADIVACVPRPQRLLPGGIWEASVLGTGRMVAMPSCASRPPCIGNLYTLHISTRYNHNYYIDNFLMPTTAAMVSKNSAANSAAGVALCPSTAAELFCNERIQVIEKYKYFMSEGDF